MKKLKYKYVEEINDCNICFNTNNKFFKCKRCVFICCPKCFNNFYFVDDVIYYPMCRF